MTSSRSGSFYFLLFFSGNNVKIATEEKGIKDVCTVLKLHMRSGPVAEAACAAILALSLDGRCDSWDIGFMKNSIIYSKKIWATLWKNGV